MYYPLKNVFFFFLKKSWSKILNLTTMYYKAYTPLQLTQNFFQINKSTFLNQKTLHQVLFLFFSSSIKKILTFSWGLYNL